MSNNETQKDISLNSNKKSTGTPEKISRFIGLCAYILVLISLYISSLIIIIFSVALVRLIVLIYDKIKSSGATEAQASGHDTTTSSKPEPKKNISTQEQWALCFCTIALFFIMIAINVAPFYLDTNNTETENEYIAPPKAIVSTPNGTIGGHGYIDLGLSVKWAAYNIGIESYHADEFKPGQIGKIYAWSDTTALDNGADIISKNWTYKGLGDISGGPHDVVRTKWGESWRLPTRAEWQELIDSCQWTKANFHRESGFMVTGPNGNSIFLPTDVFIDNSGSKNVRTSLMDNYWSSTPSEQDSLKAYTITLRNDGPFMYSGSCEMGCAIRAVTD